MSDNQSQQSNQDRLVRSGERENEGCDGSLYPSLAPLLPVVFSADSRGDSDQRGSSDEAWHSDFARRTAELQESLSRYRESVGLIAVDEPQRDCSTNADSNDADNISSQMSTLSASERDGEFVEPDAPSVSTLSAAEHGGRSVRRCLFPEALPSDVSTATASEFGSPRLVRQPLAGLLPSDVSTATASEQGSPQSLQVGRELDGMTASPVGPSARGLPEPDLEAVEEARLARQRERRANYLERQSQDDREVRLSQQRDRQAALRDSQAHAEMEARQAEAMALHEEMLEGDPFAAPPPVPPRRRVRPIRGLDLNEAAFFYDPNHDYSNHPNVLIGGLTHTCRFCAAKKFRNEAPSICCNLGKTRLPPFPSPPEPINELFSGNYGLSRDFLTHIRAYNSLFQMTSFGVRGRIGLGDNQRGFMPTFRIQGQIYHRIGDLLPMPEEEPRYLQVYFLGMGQDSGDARAIQINHRMGMARSFEPNRQIVANLQDLFDCNNNLVSKFKTALLQAPSDDASIIIRADRVPAGEHERRFNAPVHDDEAAMIVVNGEKLERDIVIQRRGGRLLRIMEMHPSYDALQYPILFWRGQSTYSWRLRQVDPRTLEPTPNKLTTLAYYSYHLMVRNDTDNFLLKCRGLLNQFVVDMWVKIESERLRFIEMNQKDLRADEYHELFDAVTNDRNPEDIGRRIVLPATFTGSPRHMHEYTQDAMAYVRHCGRPDLFITFTCNPNWPEIKEALMPNQNANDRQDIVSRVFNMKLRTMLDVIRSKSRPLFGPLRCFMYNIEWQKRGLPHAHMLLWFVHRIRPEMIDTIISAEIPDKDIDPLLYELVTTHMVHGPCDDRCIVDGKCKHHYPRSFIEETQTSETGYPLYRRRHPANGGQTFVNRNGVVIDNRNIVPHSPIFMRMFTAHINVELCSSVRSIKYVCKYINKGSDMAIMEIRQNNPHLDLNPNDEIQSSPKWIYGFTTLLLRADSFRVTYLRKRCEDS